MTFKAMIITLVIIFEYPNDHGNANDDSNINNNIN